MGLSAMIQRTRKPARVDGVPIPEELTRMVSTMVALALSRRPQVIPHEPTYRPLLPVQREIQRAWAKETLRSVGIQNHA